MAPDGSVGSKRVVAQLARPGRVTTLGVLAYVAAALFALSCVGMVLGSAAAGMDGVEEREFFLAMAVATSLYVVIALGFALVARGFLKGRRWAWPAYVVIAVLLAAAGLAGLLNGEFAVGRFEWSRDGSSTKIAVMEVRGPIASAVVLAAAGALLWVLTSAPARAFFGRTRRTEAASAR